MVEYDFDIGILGGGSAGLTVASGSAQLGAKTLLVEKEDKLGGDCLHFGVAFDRKGLKLDQRLRTNHKHIYGPGDVTGANLFTHAAGYEGGIVVSNAIFHLPRKADYTYLPWCTYTDPELASIRRDSDSFFS